MGIHCAHRVIEQIQVVVLIDGPGQRDPGFLPSRKIDPLGFTLKIKTRSHLFADLGHVSQWEHLQVGIEGTRVEDPIIEVFIEFLPEGDVGPHRLVLHPRLLGNIGNSSRHSDISPQFLHFSWNKPLVSPPEISTQQSLKEGALSIADPAHNRDQLPLLYRKIQPGERAPGLVGVPCQRCVTDIDNIVV